MFIWKMVIKIEMMLLVVGVVLDLSSHSKVTHTLTHTFYGSLDFIRDYTGELVQKETFTLSRPLEIK